MNKYDNKKTIRYMGNKNKLLEFIIPEIKSITKKGDIVCDLMCGTCSVSYALKRRNTIYANDIQYYSYVIANGMIENNNIRISSKDALNKLEENFMINMKEKKYNFFYKNYSDTYFEENQCLEIDSIRYAIDKIDDNYEKNLYLISLMFAMSKCESTSGHFAQYLPKNHKRLVTVRKRSIWNEFIKKCDDFSDLILSNFSNKSFNLDYRDLFKNEDFRKVDCVYIDTPYTGEQYSRFYHILETITKYDNPNLEFKGLYRKDRYTSNFSLRSTVKKEFTDMLVTLSKLNKKVVLSYSNKGILTIEELEYIFMKNFKHVKLKQIPYNHSTQGKGSINIREVLFVAYNRR